MHKDRLFFYKPFSLSHNCLKIYNAEGDELSLAGDDSCGSSVHLVRTQLAIFKADNPHKIFQDEVFHVTPEEFLHNLAGHLGYKVVKL